MGRFDDSLFCCNKILNDYPNNGDVLFDKSCNFAMLLKFDDSLNILERAISQEIKFKIKAKKSKSFEKLFENPKFQKLTV